MTEPPSTGTPFRVIHTADWHLGKTLGDLSREDEHARFLEFLLATISQENADLLIIAGDIFDSANPPQSAEKQYFDFLVA
ncbi:exonuclease subunit SbcD, partial [Verrucomicrobiales bacterium]|nr:exonuclease subunit SbcD [Verrucomicrobiales bacterium]